MKNFLSLVIFGFGLVNFAATHAAPAELYHLGKYKIGVTTPKDWTPVFGLYGTPISYLSDVNQTGLRATIGVYDAEIDGQTFDYAELKKDTGDYYKGRKEWLARSEASHFENELPFETVKNSQGTEGYRIGFAYELNGHEFQEYSYYLVCSDHLFHVKAIIPKGSAANSAEVTQIVQGFQCMKDSANAKKFSAISKDTVRALKKDPTKQAQMVEALRDFLIESEKNRDAKDGSTSFQQKIKTLIEGILVHANNAFADDNANCFFGGWPSHFNANHSCDLPDDIISSNAAEGCAQGEMACNPTLFGNNVCVNISDSGVKAHATVFCNAEYKKDSEKHNAEIAATLTANPNVIDETVNTVNSVCGNKAYVNANNLGLCSTLSDRLSDLGKPAAAAKQALTTANAPANYKSIHDQTDSDISAFEQICLVDGKQNFNSENPVQTPPGGRPVNCVNLAKKIKTNVAELEKIDSNYTPDSTDANACGPDGAISTLANLKNAEPTCSQAQKDKNRSSCASDVGCMVAATLAGPLVPIFQMMRANNPNAESPSAPKSCDAVKDNCVTNLLTGAAESLWSTVKGFGQIADWVKNKVVAGVKDTGHFLADTTKKTMNFFGATFQIEDQSANKGHGAAQMSKSKLAEFRDHPIHFMTDMLKGMLAGINNWMKTDVYCQKWSGVPHFSTCAKPLESMDCLDCKTSLNGACTVGGYVVAEFIPAFFLGAAEGAEVGAMVSRFLSKAEESGKLVKQTTELAKKFPAFAARAGDAMKETKVMRAAVDAAQFSGKVIKGSYAKIGKMMSDFLVDHPGLEIIADKVSADSLKIGKEGQSFGKWYAGLQDNARRAGYAVGSGGKSIAVSTVNRIDQAILARKLVKWEDAQVANAFRPEFDAGEFTNAGKNILFTQKGVDGTSEGTVIGKGLDGKSLIVADKPGNIVVLRGDDLQSVKVNPSAPDTSAQELNSAIGSHEEKLRGKGLLNQFRNSPSVTFVMGKTEHEGQLAGLAADGKNFLVRSSDNQIYVVSKDAIAPESKSAQKVIAKIEKEQAAKNASVTGDVETAPASTHEISQAVANSEESKGRTKKPSVRTPNQATTAAGTDPDDTTHKDRSIPNAQTAPAAIGQTNAEKRVAEKSFNSEVKIIHADLAKSGKTPVKNIANFALKNGYTEAYVHDASFAGTLAANFVGMESKIGRNALIVYTPHGFSPIQVEGKIVNQYPAGFDLLDVNGKRVRINSTYGSIDTVYFKPTDPSVAPASVK